jgi:hypothetical protein
MSVEQTTQLIQLILNSVLMGVACSLVLGGLIARHTTLGDEIQALNQANAQDGNSDGRSQGLQLRQQRRSLYSRYRLSRYSVLMAYYALLFSIFSGLMLALRGMLDWDWLIPVALALFALGVSTLLVAVGLTLMEWHISNRPLLDEAAHLLSLGKTDKPLRSRMGSRRPASVAIRGTRSQSLNSQNHRRAG